MTTEEFANLPLYDQGQYLWTNGTFIDFREYSEVTLQLYSVGKRFFEVYFVGEDNEITKIVEVDVEHVMKFYESKIQ